MYDVYMKGRYQFTETDDLRNFKVIDSEVSMDFHPRHGTVIPITDTELRRLTTKWPSSPVFFWGQVIDRNTCEELYPLFIDGFLKGLN